MTVIFSKVVADITDELICKFPNEYIFDTMLRNICQHNGVMVETFTMVIPLDNEQHKEQKCYRLNGVWLAMDKIYRSLLTALELSGCEVQTNDNTDGLNEMLDLSMTSVPSNVKFEPTIPDLDRPVRKSAQLSKSLISKVMEDINDDLNDAETELIDEKEGESEVVDCSLDVLDLSGKENKNYDIECTVVEGSQLIEVIAPDIINQQLIVIQETTKESNSELKALKEFRCRRCDFIFETKAEMVKHKQKHATQRYECSHCPQVFQYKRNLLRHNQNTHGEPKYHCEVCNKKYKGKIALQRHLKTHEADHEKSVVSCNQCEKTFSNQNSLDVHVKKIHMGLKKSFLCSICGKSFTTKHSLQEHSNAHFGRRPYQCATCDKTFTYESALRDHKLLHSQSKHFVCKHCEKSFSSKTGLRTHLTTHKLDKRFKCDECGRGFTQKQALQRHERVHKGEKPYICKLCGQCFTDASIIRRHLSFVHKIDKASNVWREDIICTILPADERTVQSANSMEEKSLMIEQEKLEVANSVGLHKKLRKAPTKGFKRVYPRKVIVYDDDGNVVAPSKVMFHDAPVLSVSKPSDSSVGLPTNDEITQVTSLESHSVEITPLLNTANNIEFEPQIVYSHKDLEETNWEPMTNPVTDKNVTTQVNEIVVEESPQSLLEKHVIINSNKETGTENESAIETEMESQLVVVSEDIPHVLQNCTIAQFNPLSLSIVSKPTEDPNESSSHSLHGTDNNQFYQIRTNSSSHTLPWSSIYYYTHLANTLGLNINSDLSYANTSETPCILQPTEPTDNMPITVPTSSCTESPSAIQLNASSSSLSDLDMIRTSSELSPGVATSVIFKVENSNPIEEFENKPEIKANNGNAST